MADIREVFSILENGDGSGAAPANKQEGVAPGGDNGVISLAFKDSSGNLALPQLDAAGRLGVTEDSGTEVSANGTQPGVVSTDVDVAVLSGLTVSKLHKCSLALGAATRETLWKVVQVDDVTVTTLAEFITGPGQFSYDMDLKLEFTTGATGTQELKLVGNQIRGPATDLHGTIKAVETP